MPRTPKTIETARANLEAAVPVIQGRYTEGVSRAKWAEAAASDAAETNFNQRMQQVLTSKSRQAGVRRVGDAVWRAGAIDKGAQRIGPGITASLDKWQQRFGTVYSAVLRTVATLPPRGIDPMANVDKRLKPVVTAAVQNKVRGKV